jgi:hypothetical protein
MSTSNKSSKAVLWIGRILKTVCILFMIVDASMKIFLVPSAVDASRQLGIPVSFLQPLGIYLLAATVLYSVPRTAVMGCLFLLPFLGGGTAVMLLAHVPGHPFFFPIVFGVIIVVAEYLGNGRFREVVPVGK